MSRSIRVSLLFVLAVAFMASGARANIPTPELCDVQGCLTGAPGGFYPGNPIGNFLCHIEGPIGPVNGAVVTVEIHPEAEAFIAWCVDQPHPFFTAMTDENGDVLFPFAFGGCLDPGGAFIFNTFIVQVKGRWHSNCRGSHLFAGRGE